MMAITLSPPLALLPLVSDPVHRDAHAGTTTVTRSSATSGLTG